MKILFDHPNPFLLAHGGFQTQIEQTKAGLEAAGVEVEYLRWWDDRQRGDIIHYFGRVQANYIHQAHQRGMKLVLAQLLTGLGSRSNFARRVQRLVIRTAESLLPPLVTYPFHWNSFRIADACVALTFWEAQLMKEMFGAPPDKVHVLPNGVEPAFLKDLTEQRGPWLVCTATITDRKRVLELSQAAVLARTPVWIVGKPYSESDSYANQFLELARKNSEFVRFEGPIYDREKLAQVYRQARGFVLLSTMETRSISAEEAAACGCPLLLSDLPWAKSVFENKAEYCPINRTTEQTAEFLRRFYKQAPQLPVPPKPLGWPEVGLQLKTIYEGLLKTSR